MAQRPARDVARTASARATGPARGSATTRARARARAQHRRRRLIALGALLVVALGLWVAFGRGGGKAPAKSSSAATAGETSAAGATKAGAASTAKAPAKTTGANRPKTAPASTDPKMALTAATLQAIPKNAAVLRGSHATKMVALTFDDGPSQYTQQVLDVLHRYGVQATFFVIGQNVKERPDDLKAVLDAGHVVGDHSWNHPDLTGLSPADRHSELSDTVVQIKAAGGGYRTGLMRPPYGAQNAATNVASRKMGMVPILWSDDSQDWVQGSTASAIARRVIEGVRPGSIILMHDGGGNRSQTVEALPVILEALRNQGLEPVTVPELLNGATPTSQDGDLLVPGTGKSAPGAGMGAG